MFKTFALILLVALICLGSVGVSFAYDDGDFQIWSTDTITWKFADDWKAAFETESGWADDVSEYYYTYMDIGVIYSGFAKWLDVGLNYRGVYSKSGDEWPYEHRPHVNATLKGSLYDFSLSNRSRFEFRIGEQMEDKVRFRNKTTVTAPWKWTKFEIQPYTADEIFINSDCVELSKNRIYGGLQVKLTESIKAKIYYVLESSKKTSGNWDDANILGIACYYSF